MNRISLFPSIFHTCIKIYTFPHPQTGLDAPYIIYKGVVYELYDVGSKKHSLFIGNRVISNGSLLFAVQVNPVFIVLPLLIQRGRHPYNLDSYFIDTKFEELDDIIRKKVVALGDISNYYGQDYWSFNEVKTLKYMESKYKLLYKHFEKETPSASSFHLRQKAFDIIRHHLSMNFASKLYMYISNPLPEAFSPFLYEPTKPDITFISASLISPQSSPNLAKNSKKKRKKNEIKGMKSITLYFSNANSK